MKSLSTRSCYSVDQHVSNTCRSCYYHIRALRHIRKSLHDAVIKTVASSVSDWSITTTFSLKFRSKSNFTKLQRVQNTMACVVFCRRKFEHITPALKEFHWFNIGSISCHGQTAVLVHSIQNGLGLTLTLTLTLTQFW